MAAVDSAASSVLFPVEKERHQGSSVVQEARAAPCLPSAGRGPDLFPLSWMGHTQCV